MTPEQITQISATIQEAQTYVTRLEKLRKHRVMGHDKVTWHDKDGNEKLIAEPDLKRAIITAGIAKLIEETEQALSNLHILDTRVLPAIPEAPSLEIKTVNGNDGKVRCTARGPHHNDLCNFGRVQCSNAQFTKDCEVCQGTGFIDQPIPATVAQ